MRVAVTGADGFTGRYLLPELARRGHEPVPLVADIADARALAAEVTAAAPDAIVHLAARAFVADDDYAGFYTVNQVGTFHLLDATARARPGARVILASTAQVYGAQAAGLLVEDRPVLPANHYALSKAAMEAGSRFWADRLRITVVRPFNYTGVGQEGRYLVPKIIDHFRRRAPLIELGNLDVRRDFGDVRAVADAYAGLLEASAPPAVVNVAAGVLESVRGIVARLEALTGHAMDVRVNPAFVRADDVPELGGDVGRLRAALPGWRPRPLAETLPWMLDAA
ncbi:NAD-dependent epimerase/dehydratase family protein [Sphingomonas bacterium]|uniref:NAD-dependent epimerase/dehydratase family protein n=1 Tax=Sphingomonas bacterium TaxID=1895847 RepID=UPI00157627C9|nr:NAD-dependent epimerase/dehydratase family protein [Sphingomonas bacterium]